MKIYCIALNALFLTACNENVELGKAQQAEVALEYPDHFDGAWVMSAGWMGYMGVALAVSEDRYYYWMYSDIPDDADYPYTGTFQIEGDILVLDSPRVLRTGAPANNILECGLYSDSWRITSDGFSPRLHSTTDAPEDHARTLYPDFGFDPSNPFRNQGYMKVPNSNDRSE